MCKKMQKKRKNYPNWIRNCLEKLFSGLGVLDLALLMTN